MLDLCNIMLSQIVIYSTFLFNKRKKKQYNYNIITDSDLYALYNIYICAYASLPLPLSLFLYIRYNTRDTRDVAIIYSNFLSPLSCPQIRWIFIVRERCRSYIPCTRPSIHVFISLPMPSFLPLAQFWYITRLRK